MNEPELLMDQVVALNATYAAASRQGRLELAAELNNIIQTTPDTIYCLTRICLKLKSVCLEEQND